MVVLQLQFTSKLLQFQAPDEGKCPWETAGISHVFISPFILSIMPSIHKKQEFVAMNIGLHIVLSCMLAVNYV